MKTIQELNSKWYWRLLKVSWFLLAIGIFLAVVVILFDFYGKYNPENLDNTERIILGKSSIHSVLDEYTEEFPEKSIDLSDLKRIIIKFNDNNLDASTLAGYLIIAEKLDKKIKRVAVCGPEIKLGCLNDSSKEYINESINDVNESKTVTISLQTYNTVKEAFDGLYEIERQAIEESKKVKNGNTNWGNFNSFDTTYGTDIKESIGTRNYHGLSEYIKIIIASSFILLLLIIASFMVLKISYYIILGKFNPEK